MTNQRRFRRGWVAAVCLAVAGIAAGCAVTGCSSTASAPASSQRVVDLMFQGSQLTVLGQYSTTSSPPTTAPVVTDPQTQAGLLDWQFTDASGAVLASGTVIDSRVATSEFDDNGAATPIQQSLGYMIFTVIVPNVNGTFQIGPQMAAGGVKPQGLFSWLASLFMPSSPSLTSSTSSSGSGGTGSSAGSSSSTGTGTGSSGAGSADAAPPGISQIRKSSVACPINVLIVPEAYTDMGAFHGDAPQVVQFVVGSAEYSPHARAMQFWTQDFVSMGTMIHQSPTSTEANDTAFNTQFGGAPTDAARRVITSRTLSTATATQLVQGVRYTAADIVLTLVNTTEYGGVKYQFMGGSAADGILYVTTTKNPSGNRVIVHELGHGLLTLADEYPYGTCNKAYAESINTSAQLMNLPWKDLVNLPLPSTGQGSGVGAFAGAAYCQPDAGVYRPSYDCLMRELSATWCPVCKRQYESVFAPRDQGGDGGADASAGKMDAGSSLTGSGGSTLTAADATTLVKGTTNLLACPSKLTH